MDDRVRALNDRPVRKGGRYVLYWCRWNRRVESNHALHFAAETANSMNLPLVCFERLSCAYPTACDRFHTFVLDGVPEFEAGLRKLGAGFVFQLPRRKTRSDAGMREVFAGAATVITDDCLRATPSLDVQLLAVDASCIVPMNRIPERSYAAYSIRPKIHRLLPEYLRPVPAVQVRCAPREDFSHLHTQVTADQIAPLVASCDIDHAIPPSTVFRGGRAAARKALRRFLNDRLRRYAREKNEPAAHATSELSPYLHYGHIGALEVALAVRQQAREHKLIADEFLEELIVRRELAHNFVRHTDNYQTLDALPEWARKTIHEHRRDARAGYTRAQFEHAQTDDELWNATQTELRLRGKIHGYYRMYWGKKIVEWAASAGEALEIMLYLHDRYALDGDDPNTYTNILWCFGLHDRPWPERPVFGAIRSMVRSGMERKTNVGAYVREIGHLECTGKELTS
ncbi:MAG: deoxyribodipyrimidine photo-lyase [Candidatus Solibacter sp.]